MQSRRIAILLSALLSLFGSAALAQGWDDPQADAAAARQQAENAQAEMQAKVPAMMDNQTALQRALVNQGPSYGEVPRKEPEQPKWRVVQDANGQPMLIQDTRGPAPTFQAGFGKVDPNAQADPTHGLAPLTPEMMLQHMQRSQGPGSHMWEQVGDKGFFGGIKPPTEPIEIDQEQLIVPSNSTGPAWGKDRIDKMHHYVDGQEHHGAEDPHGFF